MIIFEIEKFDNNYFIYFKTLLLKINQLFILFFTIILLFIYLLNYHF
jgi:hypothetical protein